MKQYSTDLREAVRHALDTGLATSEVARAFGVSRATIYSWATRVRQTGSVAATARPGRAPKLGAAALEQVRQRVETHPDETVLKRCAAITTQTGIVVSAATMSRTLAKLEITYKKRVSGPESKTPRPLPAGSSNRPNSTRIA